MSPDPVRHPDTIIFPASLDPQAVSVVRKLREAGYESYLVGGCVRDLLLGHIPKDFDASTEARPRQIRRVFRNCRVIGRRFKLAHVHFGSHIIEVATFRRNPSESGESPDMDIDGHEISDDNAADSVGEDDADDLLITRDNVYGTAEEDTLRRDFTINALLYDVLTGEVIDYVGGVKDVEDKILRTIGDPAIRIAEDPVRMLRAVKFTARLGLTMHPDLDAAMRASAEMIERSAPPRVLEEIYKMLTCGAASRALELLLEYGLLERLLPELADHWKQRPEELLRLGAALDHVDGAQRRIGNSFVLAMLFHDVWRERLAGAERVDPLVAARELIAPAALRMNIPRRDVSTATQLLLNQSRLERSRRGRRFRMADFLARDTTVEALDLLYVRSLAGLGDPECHARWAMRLAEHRGTTDLPGSPGTVRKEADDGDEGAPRKRRRRGGRRRSSTRRGEVSGDRERSTSDGGSSSRGRSRRDAEPTSESASGSAGSRDTTEAPQAQAEGQAPPRRRRSRGGSARTTGTGDGTGDAEVGSAADPATKTGPVANTDAAPDASANRGPRKVPSADVQAPAKDSGSGEAGITGRLKGLLRRVIGRGSPAATPTTAPTGDSGTSSEDRRDAPDDRDVPQREGRADAPSTTGRGRTDAGAAAARGTPSSGDSQPADGDQGSSDGSGAATGTTSGEGGPDSPNKRSRRPRRRRRRSGSSSSGEDRPQADGEASSDSDTGVRDDDSGDGAPASGDGSGSRTKTQRRRSRGGSGTGSESRNKKKTSSSPSRSQSGRSERSGSRSKVSRTKTKSKTRTGERDSAPPKSEDTGSEPTGRHPEDVEDMFDW